MTLLDLLERQILGPHPRPTATETLGVEPRNLLLYNNESEDGRVGGCGVHISSQLGHLAGTGGGPWTLKGTGGTPEQPDRMLRGGRGEEKWRWVGLAPLKSS